MDWRRESHEEDMSDYCPFQEIVDAAMRGTLKRTLRKLGMKF